MSSGLSSSCGTAMMLSYEEKYENKVFVVDNQRISVTQRRSVMDAIELAQNGYDGKQIQEILLREKFESSIYIMVDTLSYLKKGGRITPAAAAIGTVLRIKPVLQIQGEKLDAYAKVKTLKAAKSTMIKAIRHDFEERFHDPDGDNFYMHVAYTADDTEAQAFRKDAQKLLHDRGLGAKRTQRNDVDIGKHGITARLQDGHCVARLCAVERVEHAAAAADDRQQCDLAAGIRRDKHTQSAGEHEEKSVSLRHGKHHIVPRAV